MRLMTSVVWLALCGATFVLASCSHVSAGGIGDAGTDTGTDTDADSDTDADTDTGPACVVYVNGADGDDGNTGESWTSALATVQAGLNLAEGAGCEVWVAAGTYVPGTTRGATFQLIAGVVLYGGFAGDETALEQRVIGANETILSGEIGVADDNSDNIYHVVTGADDATIDGFTITGGCAKGVSPGSSEGGGMYNYESSPTVTNCTFSDNTADSGGGMYNDGSSPTVTGCTFSFNQSALGGGMSNGGGSSPAVTNCAFSSNSAGLYGGGMTHHNSSPTVTNCIMWGDTGESGVSEIRGLGESIDVEVDVTYSNIQGGYAGTGNIDADPLFIDAESGDLHLQSTSPCIDTGSNDAVPDDVTTDLDGNPRIVDGDSDSTATVDMGAYEVQP
ncbi:MAG: DUF1565 domain-containing protein [Proteobacteria bacterium]|jgi:hypothetical protein|nr:DUF1565 domain-containing protein [Pseudomonadota bacterium]